MRFETFIKKVLEVLERAKVKYVIVGGVAAILYGRPRTTVDLDVLVLVKEIEKFCELLKKEGFEVEKEEFEKSLKDKTHITIFHKKSPFRIDLKGLYSSLDEASLKRRRRVKIFGKKAWIESPEDLIIAKLVYGSEQDLEDVKAVLLRQKRLELKYLMKRAEEEKVSKRLKKILSGSGENRTPFSTL
jgi:ribosomal protein S8